MPKKMIEVESSGLDLGDCLADVVKAAKSGPGPALTAAVADLTKIVAAVPALPADAKEDLGEFIKGIACGLTDIAMAAIGQ